MVGSALGGEIQLQFSTIAYYMWRSSRQTEYYMGPVHGAGGLTGSVWKTWGER